MKSLNRILEKGGANAPKRSPAVIVSGLPQSGTSLMMAVLGAGGLELCVDEARAADEDNPNGYFEWSGTDQLLLNPLYIEVAAGKAVKIPSPQLRALPMDRPYKVVFMMRDLGECVDSQMTMRDRRISTGAVMPDRSLLKAQLERHRDEAVKSLKAARNIDAIFVNYADLISDPAAICDALEVFLGGALDREVVAAVVDPAAISKSRGKGLRSMDWRRQTWASCQAVIGRRSKSRLISGKTLRSARGGLPSALR